MPASSPSWRSSARSSVSRYVVSSFSRSSNVPGSSRHSSATFSCSATREASAGSVAVQRDGGDAVKLLTMNVSISLGSDEAAVAASIAASTWTHTQPSLSWPDTHKVLKRPEPTLYIHLARMKPKCFMLQSSATVRITCSQFRSCCGPGWRHASVPPELLPSPVCLDSACPQTCTQTATGLK